MPKQQQKSEKEIEKEKKRQEKIDKRRAKLVQQIKNMPAYRQWIVYSKDMGSYEKRLRYAGSDTGKKELRKMFGDALDKTPKNWDQVELDLLQHENDSFLKDFIKLLVKFMTTMAGV